jgi:hypothetical protein
VNKSVIPVSYGRKGNLQWDDFKQKRNMLVSWDGLTDELKAFLIIHGEQVLSCQMAPFRNQRVGKEG